MNTINVCTTEGASHPSSNERVHDILEASPPAGAPDAPQPGQPHRQQDPRRVVVLAQVRREAEVHRAGQRGDHLFIYYIHWRLGFVPRLT